MIQIIVIILKKRAIFKDMEGGVTHSFSESSSLTDPDSAAPTPGPGRHICQGVGPFPAPGLDLGPQRPVQVRVPHARPEELAWDPSCPAGHREEHAWG